MGDFAYLKQYDSKYYKDAPEGQVYEGSGSYDNIFFKVDPHKIEAAEKKLGFPFPSLLKQFYIEIGYGLLRAKFDIQKDYEFDGANEILPPLVAAAFYKPLAGNNRPIDKYEPIDSGDGNHYMAAMTYEILQPGDLPFFEISDSTRFLVMRPHSENPNAVWTSSGIKIEDSFEKFIWRLYYEDPSYYDDIIESYYENLGGGS